MIKNKVLIKRFNLCVSLFLIVFVFFVGNEKIIAADINQNFIYVSKTVEEICAEAQQLPISSSNMRNDGRDKSYKCDSFALYYGFEHNPDYIKAKKCALRNNRYDVLSMIYANGKGVSVDFNRAIHYACMMNAASAEMKQRIMHLDKLRRENSTQEDFNICDDITSGHMMRVCASFARRVQKAQQRKMLTNLKRKWTASELEMFAQLEIASMAYFKSRIDHEMEGLGTGATAFAILEDISLNERMMKTIDKLEKCNVPLYTQQQYLEMDKKLNLIYNQLKKKKFSDFSTLSFLGIKKTEIKWIKYKNAWVALGHIKCPKISKTSWSTLITKERIKELEDI